MNPLDIMAGDMFARAITAGQIPPPGYAFINRFCHSLGPDDLVEQADGLPHGDLDQSLSNLLDALDDLGRNGAPAPIIAGLEDAVTSHLSAYTLRHIDRLDDTGNFGRENLAFLLRETAASTDAAIATTVPALEQQPGNCVRVCLAVLDEGAQRFKDDPSAISEVDPASPDFNPMAKAMRSMTTATTIAKQYI